LISAIIFAFALIAFIFLIFFNRQTMKIVELFLRLVPESLRKPIYNLLNVFTAGIEFLRNPKTLFLVLLSSLFIWLTEAGFYYSAALSFGFDISMLQALFLKGILNLGILVPSAPGYVGTFEFFVVEAMALIGVSETPALGYALVSHFVEFASISIVGIFFWIRYGLSLSDIKQESRED
ncbi:flippase-like domain-containing protein, partial [candidate division WWE3 bacterium]|nr:flippase-like domain-containing protein [candidate division WWE3 bacterium]